MFRKINTGLMAVSLAVLASCSGGNKNTGEDSTPEAVFHADYDIAMIVSSLADAIKVGEQLDSADYNFTGVLTDGTGRALYTTPAGHPGKWHIEVTDTVTAKIRNIETGDLMVDDLREYLVSALHLEEAREYVGRDFKDRKQMIYSIPNGYLLFTETRDTTSVDTTARHVSIIIRK